MCSRTVAWNHRAVVCGLCGLKYHIKYGSISLKHYRALLSNHQAWYCSCTMSNGKVNSLLFACVSDELFTLLFREQEQQQEDNGVPIPGILSDSYLQNIALDLDTVPKDLRITHLNICSLRNKIEDLRVLQCICQFDILGITELHLNSLDANHNIYVCCGYFVFSLCPFLFRMLMYFFTFCMLFFSRRM